MVDDYNDTQIHILVALQRSGGREVSGTVKDMVQDSKTVSISRSGVDKQIQNLCDSGEIEVVGKTDTSENRMGSNVYALTDIGKEAAERCVSFLEEGGLFGQKVRAVRNADSEALTELEELKTPVEELQETVEAQAQQLEQNEERFRVLDERTKELRSMIEELQSEQSV